MLHTGETESHEEYLLHSILSRKTCSTVMKMFRRLQLMITHLSATRPGAWFVRTCIQPFDRFVLWISGGRLGIVSLFYTTLVLITTGARSGMQRRTPLIFFPDGSRLVLVASNFGRPHHPGWYYNVLANPQVHVNIYGHTFSCRAREASGIEYLELWERAVRYYPGFATYARRAGRTVPIVVLDLNTPT
jgi:deazaflavin-dependent oxidoreductase (nitroreductase family)